jgi:hypothetical protein
MCPPRRAHTLVRPYVGPRIHFGIPIRARRRSKRDWPPGRGPCKSGISRTRGDRPSRRMASTSSRISRATRSPISISPTPGSDRPWISNCRASAGVSAAPPGIPARAKASKVRASAMTNRPWSLMANLLEAGQGSGCRIKILFLTLSGPGRQTSNSSNFWP